MQRTIFFLPVVLGVGLLGCSPPAEEVTPNGPITPSAGGANTGGSTAQAGTAGSSGGASGGMSGSGGDIAGGGQTVGGQSGASGSAGSAGSGGGSTGGGPLPTTGCGKEPGQALGDWQVYDVPLSGMTLLDGHTHTSREIFVRLPPDYNPATPYRVVYLGVGCTAPDGASAAYPMWDTAQGGDTQAIYVAMSLPDPPTNNNCYDNRAGVDSIEWESLDHDHAFVSDLFCIDNNKVFMGGYSSGGWIANMFSCYFGGIPTPPRTFLPNVQLRGAMAVAGCWTDTPTPNPECNGPIGGMWIHDESDAGANPYSCAVEQRDRVLAQNGCADGAAGPTEVWGADFINDGECLKYTNCPAEYPVIFCSTTGRGHNSQNDNAIAGFNAFVSDIEAAVAAP